MKNRFITFIQNKYYLFILWIICLAFLPLGIKYLETWFLEFLLIFLSATTLLFLISIIYQIIQKQWFRAIAQFFMLMGLGLAFTLFSIAAFFHTQSMPDDFGKEHPIPSGIEFSQPLELENRTEMAKPTQKDLILYNSFQPGIYEFDVWLEPLEPGEIYLKAFEISENIPLSESRIKEQSLIAIPNISDSLSLFQGNFTIYEGDWGDEYGARIEVWFKNQTDKKERKLFEKNFIIQGWMR